jgi:T-complex protein 1 subunit eta
MVVDAVLTLDQNELDEKLIGIKKIPGGAMQVNINFFYASDNKGFDVS